MAGKNDCGMEGKGWREHMTGNGWREDMVGRGWRETGGGTYGGKAFAGKYFFSMSKMGNGCIVFIYQFFLKKIASA